MLRRLRERAIVALPLASLACGSSGTRGVSADASTTPLVPEAGFTDVPPLPDGGYAARMFYVFQPADEDATHKPLFVLFNGSSHLAMEVGLLAYGTGRTTLDSNAPDAAPAANSARWTRFANLLYLDSRDSGFSYYLGTTAPGARDSDAAAPQLELSQPQDAADFVRALLNFLDSHPPLRASPVVLVGESEGGIRATWMLDLLLRYSTETPHVEDDLRARIQAHYDLVFPTRAESIVDEATAATQFGAQVLIEPLVLGCQCAPFTDTRCMATVDGGGDPDDSIQLQLSAVAAWADPAAARALVGVDLGSIPMLLPDARTDAFRAQADPGQMATTAPVNRALTARFGALPQPWDRYFDMQHAEEDSAQPGLGGGNPPTDPFDATFPSKFIENLRRVRTFITDAYCDGRVYSPGIPTALGQEGLHVVIDTAPRPGVARPGWFRVTFPSEADAGPPIPGQTIEVRFPPYATSGHMVAAFQPAELAADVQDWIEGK